MSIKRYKKESLNSYSLGITLTIEAIKRKGNFMNKVYLNPSYEKGESFEEIKKLCKENNIDIEINSKVFNVLSDKDNCYVIGEFQKFYTQLEKGCHVVLVNPSNMGNLGTILRSCLGFNITNIAIISPACDVFDPKVIRASMGAIFNLNIKYYDSFYDYQNEFKENALYPFMLQSSKSIHNIIFKDNFSLIFGNEATGLDKSYLGIGENVIIPHSKKIDSLNLPIAVSIALFEATKNSFK